MIDSSQPVTESRVESAIDSAFIETEKMGRKTLVMCARLPNGFEVVTRASCVDPDDYDEEIAEEICRERLKEKVFEVLGFQQHPPL